MEAGVARRLRRALGRSPRSPLRVSPWRFCAASHVSVTISGRVFACLPRNSLFASLHPRGHQILTQSAGTRWAASSRRAESPPFPLELREPPAVTPSRRRKAPARTPADESASPLRSLLSDRVRFPSAPRRRFRTCPAPRAPRRGQGSPGSSPHLRRGHPRRGFPARGAPRSAGRALQGDAWAAGPRLLLGSPPHQRLSVSGAWRTCLPEESVLCPCLQPGTVQPGTGGKLVPKQYCL